MRHILAAATASLLALSAPAFAQTVASPPVYQGTTPAAQGSSGSGGQDAYGQGAPNSDVDTTGLLLGGAAVIGGGALIAVLVNNNHDDNNTSASPVSP